MVLTLTITALMGASIVGPRWCWSSTVALYAFNEAKRLCAIVAKAYSVVSFNLVLDCISYLQLMQTIM